MRDSIPAPLSDTPPRFNVLELQAGEDRWLVGERPMAIGRGTEADIVVPGSLVSRVHAWIVPTTEGPLLVDRSRHGTLVNGAVLAGPAVLAPGDEVQVGRRTLRVGPPTRTARRSRPVGGVGRVRRWLLRYGPSELAGTIAAVGIAVLATETTGSVVVGGYAGSLAEAVVFYGIMFLRDSVRAAHHAGGRGKPFGSRDLLPVGRGLLLEFGVAELADLLFLRPLCLGLGVRLLGGTLGALAGKLVSDLVFYGPVLAIYEWRLARGEARTVPDARRRTTAQHRVPDRQ